MKNVLVVIVFCSLINLPTFSQKKDTIYRTYYEIQDLLNQTKESGINLYLYCDSSSGYKIIIPNWLNLKETYDDKMLGGTFPAVNGIENAFMISAFEKTKFKSFEDFKTMYLIGNKFGNRTLYSNEHIWYGQNELQEIKNGVSRKVFTLWRNNIYHNKFILIETPKAFLWIQFTATPETYDVNVSKFNELMKGFEIIN